MHKYFKDVDSEEDFKNVRYRKSTAKSVFDYTLGYLGQGFAGMLNNLTFHEDDDNPKFKGLTYVTYIPVDKKELSNIEQQVVREKAVARLSGVLNTQKNAHNWKSISRTAYFINLSGETCELLGNSYAGTKLENMGCASNVYPSIVSVTSFNKNTLLDNINNQFFAIVKIAIAAAKNVDINSFVAFNDLYKTRNSLIATPTQVVVTSGSILPFLNPQISNIKIFPDSKVDAAICVRLKNTC